MWSGCSDSGEHCEWFNLCAESAQIEHIVDGDKAIVSYQSKVRPFTKLGCLPKEILYVHGLKKVLKTGQLVEVWNESRYVCPRWAIFCLIIMILSQINCSCIPLSSVTLGFINCSFPGYRWVEGSFMHLNDRGLMVKLSGKTFSWLPLIFASYLCGLWSRKIKGCSNFQCLSLASLVFSPRSKCDIWILLTDVLFCMVKLFGSYLKFVSSFFIKFHTFKCSCNSCCYHYYPPFPKWVSAWGYSTAWS